MIIFPLNASSGFTFVSVENNFAMGEKGMEPTPKDNTYRQLFMAFVTTVASRFAGLIGQLAGAFAQGRAA